MDAVMPFIRILGDVLITAAVVLLLNRQTMQAQKVATHEQSSQAYIESMKDYREWNSWDQKIVYAPDVISAILEYRGDPILEINEKGASAANSWKRSDSYKQYTANNTKDSDISAIYTAFEDSTKKYIAVLERNANGAVSTIHFVKQF